MITNLTFPIITFTMFNILDISEGQTKIYYQLTSQKLTIMLERTYFYEANFGVKSMLKYRIITHGISFVHIKKESFTALVVLFYTTLCTWTLSTIEWMWQIKTNSANMRRQYIFLYISLKFPTQKCVVGINITIVVSLIMLLDLSSILFRLLCQLKSFGGFFVDSKCKLIN